MKPSITAPLAITLSAALAHAQLADGSFESSGPLYPSPAPWTQFSTNFGTPLCDGSCFGPGEPTAARSGQWWAWFGGTDTAIERGLVSQTITIPPGSASIRFYLNADSDRSTPLDYLKVLIDGAPVWTIFNHQLGAYAADYLPVDIDISAYSGATRIIQFDSETFGGGFLTNFFVDDVSLILGPLVPCYPNCDGSSVAPVLTANDFQCFLNKYAANSPYANCDGSTVQPTLTANDFQCFLNKYASGCS